MTNEKLKYFVIAKELNSKHHDELIRRNLHFRGSINSFSLISLSPEYPEIGEGGLKTIEKGEEKLKTIVLDKNRATPEKHLQAWIINYCLNNNLKLPFGNYTFLTSELAFPTEERKQGYVNDVLAVDDKNTLIIIELKSLRTNEVKIQAIEYEEKVVNKNMDFFHELVTLMLDVKWNGETKKVSVWPYKAGNNRKQEHLEVEELNYTQVDNNYIFQ